MPQPLAPSARAALAFEDRRRLDSRATRRRGSCDERAAGPLAMFSRRARDPRRLPRSTDTAWGSFPETRKHEGRARVRANRGLACETIAVHTNLLANLLRPTFLVDPKDRGRRSAPVGGTDA